MVDKLYVNDMGDGREFLGGPESKEIAGADCCCPECIICYDNFTRSDASNINTGAPMTWAGADIGSFSIASNQLKVSVSNKEVTACDGDRVSVLINRIRTTSAHDHSYALVKLGSVTVVVKFPSYPSTGLPGTNGTIQLTGAGVTGCTIPVPTMADTAWIVICVKQYSAGIIGVTVYDKLSGKLIWGSLTGTHDPDTATFGTAKLASGELDETHSNYLLFDYFKVEHGRGDPGGDYEDCPTCNPRPCYAASTGAGEAWDVLSGTWETGNLISYYAYSTIKSDALAIGGAPRGGLLLFSYINYSNDTNVRVYATRDGAGSTTPSADYVELVHPQGTNPGCVTVYRNGSAIASQVWNPSPTEIEVSMSYGAGAWIFSASYLQDQFVIQLPGLARFKPAIGLGSAPSPFAGGIEISLITLERLAEGEDWPCCVNDVITCPVYETEARDVASIGHSLSCGWTVVSGTAAYGYDSSGDGAPCLTTAGYVQRNTPYPTLRAGGYSYMGAWLIKSGASSGHYGNAVKFAWNNGDSYVLHKFIDPADLGGDSVRLGSVVSGLGNVPVIWELWHKGSKVAQTDALAYYSDGSGNIEMRIVIVLQGGFITVTQGFPDPWLLFRYELDPDDDYGDGPYWGMGYVGTMPTGYRMVVNAQNLYHTSSDTNLYLPTPGPAACPNFIYQSNLSVCSGNPLPSMYKVVIDGIIDGISCTDGTCDNLNAIYFCPATFTYPYYLSYRYFLPPTTTGSCEHDYYVVGVDVDATDVAAFIDGPSSAEGTATVDHCSGLTDYDLTSSGANDKCKLEFATFKVTSIA